jgi:hypothetical protein
MSASYGALFVILIWQALRGEALIDPGAATLVVLGIWAAATAVALRLHTFDFGLSKVTSHLRGVCAPLP